MANSDRYYTPQDSKDAMRQIEKLFNKYKDAPLTQELVDYHQNLVNRLKTDILAAATKEGVQSRIDSLNSMIDVMNKWLQVRLSGRPYAGKMAHFQFVADNAQPQFKRRVHKMKGSSNHRASGH
ncbi:hypothetical protein [Lentilactobacillus kisonensis]|uniref:Uncharacterized protein n=1 Tax=Lentilactobacillus kisonensis DSM 19906 = JCM 15041 TaxID=1423766 RepID=A0A0R1NI86_9LACO|nr:hypothetical protein [Lentilactobacillus kisonensis]KRL20125.1 hypothetical protein FC98_GL001835 [Lentilactobacillus kisonensis DSM 19906 = JCM 15041]